MRPSTNFSKEKKKKKNTHTHTPVLRVGCDLPQSSTSSRLSTFSPVMATLGCVLVTQGRTEGIWEGLTGLFYGDGGQSRMLVSLSGEGKRVT